ncbi:ATP-binding protein [Streptomyces sp. YC504]|uniref:ATP-binding protein n=1 Tax=Streptomyces mesophilus TaxID=1775132 RepID=A0A6G4XIM2_9ACTN|nr:ATP-binding protein [Streptomyces mesophilus]NGO76481.1 ATP-binding protein [Streptomyces mesophilus]
MTPADHRDHGETSDETAWSAAESVAESVADSDLGEAAEPDRDDLPSGAQARHLVRTVMLEHAASLGMAEVPQERLTDAQLVCSELLSNARRHGGGLTSVRIWAEDGHVVIAVADENCTLPLSPHRTAAEPGGFGWALVRRVTTRTTIHLRPDGQGKTITAHVPLSASGPAPGRP